MNELRLTLSEMVKSGSSSPALDLLIQDYTKYHAIFVIIGGLLVLTFIYLSLIFWSQFKRTSKIDTFKWGFEKKVYFYFGILSSFVALLMLLIVVANVTNVLHPMHGFSLLIR
ncbi:hypothetical protein [Priestia megaterium]|uniref:hypothetical protein n=1 Tax=Priestia megaterium TaxID=1404 RepID=UPI00366CC0CE